MNAHRSEPACGVAQPNPRFDRGLEVLGHRDAADALKRLRDLGEIAPDFAAYFVEHALGDIAGRPGLDLKVRALLAVAVLAALRVSADQLAGEIRHALVLGWSRAELIELMTQLSVYAGYPVAIRGLEVLADVAPGED